MKIIVEQISVGNKNSTEATVCVGVFDDANSYKVVGEKTFTISLVNVNNTADLKAVVLAGISAYATAKLGITILDTDIIWI